VLQYFFFTPFRATKHTICQNLSACILKAAANRRPCESQWPTRLVRCSRSGPPPSHGLRPFPYRLPRRRRVASSSSYSVFEEEKKQHTLTHIKPPRPRVPWLDSEILNVFFIFFHVVVLHSLRLRPRPWSLSVPIIMPRTSQELSSSPHRIYTSSLSFKISVVWETT
jgi:hypothetical protein